MPNPATNAGVLPTVGPEARDRYLQASETMSEWLAETVRFGASAFLGPNEYFVPVPVALLMVEEDLLQPAQPSLPLSATPEV